MPRDLQDLALRVERLNRELASAGGIPPSAAELAEQAGVCVEDILEAREAYRAQHAVSLDQPRRSEADEDASLADTLPAEETEIPLAEDRVLLDSLLATLDPRSEQIVRLYHHAGAHPDRDRPTTRLLTDARLAPAPPGRHATRDRGNERERRIGTARDGRRSRARLRANNGVAAAEHPVPREPRDRSAGIARGRFGGRRGVIQSTSRQAAWRCANSAG